MRPGGLVLIDEGINLLVELDGGWNKPMINMGKDRFGLVLEEENFWGEQWIKVLVPQGIGWVACDFCELIFEKSHTKNENR